MVVQHNLPAMNANRYLGINNSKLSKSLEKLSSGYAINRAGDNAAGLAVSEKMRSQIAGMTQGVKNAQDGISMVQTFEGALTETHSILQRMKTLADQMANGSYDDPVDRTAAQQEFLQLNDELDQIADTDFNGVIVLNGGKMADGLEQVDGMFDYANKAGQVQAANDKALADAQAAAQKKIDSAQKAFDSALAVYNTVTNRDRGLEGKALGFNTLDNSQYTAAAAKKLFGDAVVNGKATDDKVTDSLAAKGIDAIDVTYTATKAADGTITWEATKATYTDPTSGEETEIGNKADVLGAGKVIDPANMTATSNGGFKVGTTTTNNKGDSTDATYGNVVLDETEVKTGDVVVLRYTNPASSVAAPKNIGIDENSLVNKVDGTSIPTLKLSDKVKDANMNEEMQAALDALNKSEIEFAYSSTDIVPTINDASGLLSIKAKDGVADKNEFEISYTDSKGNEQVIASVTTVKAHGVSKQAAPTMAMSAAATSGSTTFELKADGWYNGDDKLAGITAETTYDGMKFAAATLTGLATTGFNVGDKLIVSATTANDTTTNVTVERAPATVDNIKFGVALDKGTWSANAAKPTIEVSKSTDPTVTDATAIDTAYADAKAALEEAKAAMPKSIDDLGEEYKVSKSDAFDKSEAKMTYKDNITLQVGARTKDAVNFTFKYDSTSIGDLDADLNCTAKGLGTDKLNLSTQENANYAIDKIDQAINKVSLIRGTFGAIQNRLEHKIDNMNVSIENLTSAESAIRDTNMPQEMMNFTKQQILAQASQSMLAQANQLPQGVLSLLQ